MNEQANFCSQCGSKISSGVKFCSNCGHDFKNSPTKITSDKTIKVEVTNVTMEKGFSAIEKGLKKVLRLDTPSQKRLERQAPQPEMTTTEIIKSLITVVGIVAFIVLLGLLIEWLYLNT
ncbi:uncharacterized protein METZ01_LOCUS473503 [marine metagenome]|uniref:Zinc-ribbon domain-containing protein n=1 Tax=marine metagenome TaxID=408172 RepID=A0A383BL93_9ZZZZ